MKLLYEVYNQSHHNTDIWLGIGGYRHHPKHPWTGFAIEVYIARWMIQFIFVSNLKAYKAAFRGKK